MRHFLTKALILRKQPSGENDWYLTLFSPELGKIRAVSRASRKICSQKGGHLDILNLCQFQLYHNNNRLLITDCKIENSYLGIKNHLQKSLIGFTITELLLKTIQEEAENPELFAITIQALDDLSQRDDDLTLEEFKIKLLREAGSWPDIALCYFCQNKWTEAAPIFCDHQGHLCCQDCLTANKNCHDQVCFNTIKLAKFLAEKNHLPVNLKVTREQLFGLKKLTAVFMQNYLHQELNSEKLLYC
jgi:DNA repair protein RecO (recombination protein O)